MMFSRAISNGVRWYCPDILVGVYTPDELDQPTDEEGNLALSVTPVEAISMELEQQNLPITTAVATNGNPHNERVKLLRTLLGIEGKAVLEWLKTEMLVKTPAELETTQVDELVQWMALQWAAKQGMQHNHALNTFNKYVPTMISQGYTEVDAIGLWMQHIQQQLVERDLKSVEVKEVHTGFGLS